MTNRERAFADLGIEYAEGIDLASVVTVPSTGRKIRKNKAGKWEAQPWNDNYWNEFDDLLDAVKFATRPAAEPPAARQECEHDWHLYGTVNGVPEYGCQKCGATRRE